ncbi:unnamed protein product [Ilex paraguariensis]|uniref:Major facilitator superfamily (MFS) profile domain-containing protein n=1 Tax=Ilex paraguariensis TaxID=185542 RepID=A0ABC8SSG5_9AQUA
MSIGSLATCLSYHELALTTRSYLQIHYPFLVLKFNCAYASEVCRKEYQALGMSVVSTSWGIGLVIGPAIGGFLAQPAEKYPNVFSEESIFGRLAIFLVSILPTLPVDITLCIGCRWYLLLASAALPDSLGLACTGAKFCTMNLETLHIHHGNKEEQNDTCDVLEGTYESDALDNGGNSEGASITRQSLLKNWPLMSSIIVYCIFQLHDMAYTEPSWFGDIDSKADDFLLTEH